MAGRVQAGWGLNVVLKGWKQKKLDRASAFFHGNQ
jgi:hypothetical protein